VVADVPAALVVVVAIVAFVVVIPPVVVSSFDNVVDAETPLTVGAITGVVVVGGGTHGDPTSVV